jgi:hypothetical protein
MVTSILGRRDYGATPFRTESGPRCLPFDVGSRISSNYSAPNVNPYSHLKGTLTRFSSLMRYDLSAQYASPVISCMSDTFRPRHIQPPSSRYS